MDDEVSGNARLFGAFAALQTLIKALVAIHPDPDQLRQAIEAKNDSVMALFLAEAQYEATLSTYQSIVEEALDILATNQGNRRPATE